MLDISLKSKNSLQQLLAERQTDFLVQTNSHEEKVKLLIVRDLMRLGWNMNIMGRRVLIKPPDTYDKQTIKDSMEIKRRELLQNNPTWIKTNLEIARQNLADGEMVWKSKVEPVVEVCETQSQFDLFKILRFYWSSPYSEYVGRRIKLLIRDNALPNKPIIGIAALGSSIIHIPDRDNWIGWDTQTRTQNLVYTMDAYVLGALPPYNYILGGKLLSYIVASNEVRNIYERKYKGKVTNISKRKANRLACIFVTSLYGKSSQYNRIKFNDEPFCIPIGHTKGYGTLHLTNETFNAMRDLLDVKGISVTNRFGDGPIWRMRVIRTAANILGFDADFLLRHSFQRGIYAIPLARNFKEFLQGQQQKLSYFDYPLDELTNYWKRRWLDVRKNNIEVKKNVYSFRVDQFGSFGFYL